MAKVNNVAIDKKSNGLAVTITIRGMGQLEKALKSISVLNEELRETVNILDELRTKSEKLNMACVRTEPLVLTNLKGEKL